MDKIKELKEGTGIRLETVLNEVSAEITKTSSRYVILIKQGKEIREWTFEIYKLQSLKTLLLKNYGSIAVTKIISELSKAITNRTLDNFAKDKIVDFEIKEGKAKLSAKTKTLSKKEGVNEATIEFKKSQGTPMILINNVKFNGDINSFKLKHPIWFNAIKKQIITDGKKWSNLVGDDGVPDMSITANAKSGKLEKIKINYDA